MRKIVPFAVALIGFALRLVAADLHVILACDTLGSNIGESVNKDFLNMRKEVRIIAKNTGLNLQETVIKGPELTVNTLFRALQNLQVQSDDVVLFYFSGHGYRTEDKGDNVWPNCFITTGLGAFDLLDVSLYLKDKGARFTIAVGDCCNNVISPRFAPKKQAFRSLAVPKKDVDVNWRKLFLETRGLLLMSGCEPGQVSYGFSNLGGLFTISFVAALHDEVEKQTTPNWNHLLDTARETVSQVTLSNTELKRQDPQYQMLEP